MTIDEFNRISGKTCAPEMFSEIERIYMAFEGITKKELAHIYWGEANSYLLYLEAKYLADKLRAGFKSDAALDQWVKDRDDLIREIKALKIN